MNLNRFLVFYLSFTIIYGETVPVIFSSFLPSTILQFFDYSVDQTLNLINIFVCESRNDSEAIDLGRFLMDKGKFVQFMTFVNLGEHDFQQGVILDLNCHNSKEILSQAADFGFFNSKYQWLLLDNGQFDNNFWASLKLNINCGVTLLRRSNQEYVFIDLWSTGTNESAVRETILQYSIKNPTKIQRRINLSGLIIRVMLVMTDPITGTFEETFRSIEQPHLNTQSRFTLLIMDHVRGIFNFTFKLRRTKSWGYQRNNTFDGMLGALIRDEADIGGSPIFYRLERAAVVEYTAKTWELKPMFVFRHPDTRGVIRNVLLQPFTNKVWLSIFGLGLISVILLRLILFVEDPRSDCFHLN